MSDNKSQATTWTGVQAYTLAVVCLLLGVAGGWFIRGSQSPAAPAANVESAVPANVNAQPTPEQMRKMADTQAAPLLEQLKSNANDPQLLGKIGNIYYDVQDYATAISYYLRALNIQPADADVRTDLATAYWYTGNPDSAIQEFNKALSYAPNKANTLFNLGVVQWQGKMDIKSAVATWQKLLATNPNYENKDRVKQLIAEAEKHTNVKPGTAAKPLSN
ncbi:MAG TPA: tetratricopeptide repeat protein [Terriglobales bacterium]|nr:tetratricopeptide repeat protein [Terriglobales bacterium]